MSKNIKKTIAWAIILLFMAAVLVALWMLRQVVYYFVIGVIVCGLVTVGWHAGAALADWCIEQVKK